MRFTSRFHISETCINFESLLYRYCIYLGSIYKIFLRRNLNLITKQKKNKTILYDHYYLFIMYVVCHVQIINVIICSCLFIYLISAYHKWTFKCVNIPSTLYVVPLVQRLNQIIFHGIFFFFNLPNLCLCRAICC